MPGELPSTEPMFIETSRLVPLECQSSPAFQQRDIKEIKTRVYGKRQTSDSRLCFLKINYMYTRMVQNNSMFMLTQNYLLSLRNSKRSTANEEKSWLHGNFCHLLFAGNARLYLSIYCLELREIIRAYCMTKTVNRVGTFTCS